MTAAFFLTIHIITIKVIVKLLSVILLLFLNMSERISQDGAGKFKDSGVINTRDVLFH